jgi:asparagine synthase (glutamine-hydrolysing)
MGTWVDESMGVYAGWVAHKDSFSDGMPLRNERGDMSLVFSGEEYPEPGTVRHLRERGHAVAAEGPSYLVHLYEEDPSFPAGLNGRFHGLLTDRNRGTTILFNDRYGMQRIYYHEAKEAFYFATEAKAILAVRPELRKVDPRALSRPFLERTGLEAIVLGHLKGDRNYTTEIHKVLTLELLHRVFIDAA